MKSINLPFAADCLPHCGQIEGSGGGQRAARRAEPSVSDLVDVNYHRAIAIGAALAPVALVEIGSLEVIDKQPLLSDELAVFEKHLDPRAGSQTRDANLDTGQLGRRGAILMLAEDWRFLTVGADQHSLSPKGPSPLVKERDAVHQLSGCPDLVQRQLQLLPLGGQRQSAHSG